MDGVKVTYIETRFVTSDAAGFKDLVQRLTGRSSTAAAVAPAPAAPPHRPHACRAAADYCGRSASAAAAAAAAGAQQGYHYHHASSPSAAAAHEPRIGDERLAPPCLGETAYGVVGDFAGLLYGGSASQNAQWGILQ